MDPREELIADFNSSFTSVLIPDDLFATFDTSEKLALLCETLTDRLADAKLSKHSAETFFEMMHDSYAMFQKNKREKNFKNQETPLETLFSTKVEGVDYSDESSEAKVTKGAK